MKIVILALVLVASLNLVARGDQMMVAGAENGQGYVFTVYSRCFVVTAAHVVDTSEPGKVTLTVRGDGAKSFTQTRSTSGLPGNIGYWLSPSDVAVMQLDPPANVAWNPCAGSASDPALPEADGALVLFVDQEGTHRYYQVDVSGSDDGRVLLKGRSSPGQACDLQKGLSGGLALDGSKRILGILTDITAACAGIVLPIDAINQLIAGDNFQLPIHTLSQQLNDAILAADFDRYSQLIQQVGDPNSVDTTQISALDAALSDKTAPSLGFPNDSAAQKDAAQQQCELWIEGRLQIAADLVRRGADVNFGGNESGWTPLMTTAGGGASECVGSRFADFLIANRADLNRRWKWHNAQDTALHMAVWVDIDVPVLRALLAAGANTSLRNRDGETPLMLLVDSATDTIGGAEDCDGGDNLWTTAFKILHAHSDPRLTMPSTEPDPDKAGKTVDAYLRGRYNHEWPGFDRCIRSIYPDLPND